MLGICLLAHIRYGGGHGLGNHIDQVQRDLGQVKLLCASVSSSTVWG